MNPSENCRVKPSGKLIPNGCNPMTVKDCFIEFAIDEADLEIAEEAG